MSRKKSTNIAGWLIALVCTGGVLTGCTKNFDSINSNPDKSTSSRADWLATSLLTSVTSGDISSQKSFAQPFMLGKYVLWTEDQESFQYNYIQRTGFGRIPVLRNVIAMNKYAALDPSTQDSYVALGHFLRAWQFFQTTMQVGDIPYSEALQGETTGNIKPRYDSQKSVFQGILNELDSANALFATGKDFAGDFIFKGSVDKWQRLTNAFELHVLMNLYKKTADADLKVIARFKDIVANRPLMRDYTDNFAVTYLNTAGYCYPWSNTAIQKNPFVIYPMVSATIIDLLKATQDRRLFCYAEPAATQIEAGIAPSDFNAYIGVEPSAPYSVTTSAHSAGKFSDFNKRYADLYNAEPVSLFSYWEQEFLLAEATVRGWISGIPAQTYYAQGIQSSMNFIAKNTATGYTHGVTMDAAYIAGYPATVALAGSTEDQIRQIITQKYMAGFLQGVDYNAWYENRRTGYPAFILNPSTNLNTVASQFPLRWMYPQGELDNNGQHVKAAIDSQYGGNDDVNQAMWILK